MEFITIQNMDKETVLLLTSVGMFPFRKSKFALGKIYSSDLVYLKDGDGNYIGQQTDAVKVQYEKPTSEDESDAAN